MFEKDFVPTCLTHDTLIVGYYKYGNVEKSITLYEEMTRHDIMPDTVTYSRIIQILCMSGNMVEVTNFLHKISKRGFKHDLFYI
jgi:pentatricopeptide repeat protein